MTTLFDQSDKLVLQLHQPQPVMPTDHHQMREGGAWQTWTESEVTGSIPQTETDTGCLGSRLVPWVTPVEVRGERGD